MSQTSFTREALDAKEQCFIDATFAMAKGAAQRLVPRDVAKV